MELVAFSNLACPQTNVSFLLYLKPSQKDVAAEFRYLFVAIMKGKICILIA